MPEQRNVTIKVNVDLSDAEARIAELQLQASAIDANVGVGGGAVLGALAVSAGMSTRIGGIGTELSAAASPMLRRAAAVISAERARGFNWYKIDRDGHRSYGSTSGLVSIKRTKVGDIHARSRELAREMMSQGIPVIGGGSGPMFDPGLGRHSTFMGPAPGGTHPMSVTGIYQRPLSGGLHPYLVDGWGGQPMHDRFRDTPVNGFKYYSRQVNKFQEAWWATSYWIAGKKTSLFNAARARIQPLIFDMTSSQKSGGWISDIGDPALYWTGRQVKRGAAFVYGTTASMFSATKSWAGRNVFTPISSTLTNSSSLKTIWNYTKRVPKIGAAFPELSITGALTAVAKFASILADAKKQQMEDNAAGIGNGASINSYINAEATEFSAGLGNYVSAAAEKMITANGVITELAEKYVNPAFIPLPPSSDTYRRANSAKRFFDSYYHVDEAVAVANNRSFQLQSRQWNKAFYEALEQANQQSMNVSMDVAARLKQQGFHGRQSNLALMVDDRVQQLLRASVAEEFDKVRPKINIDRIGGR